MKAIATTLGILFAAVLLVVLNGTALHYLWGWYIVPNFNAPPLSWATAAGVQLVLQLVLPRRTPPSRDQDNREAAMAFVHPILALLIGWLLLGWV